MDRLRRPRQAFEIGALILLAACAPRAVRYELPTPSAAPPEPAAPAQQVEIAQAPEVAPTDAYESWLPPDDVRGQQIVAAAQRFLGVDALVVNGETYRWDCTGLVEAIYAQFGLPYWGSVDMFFDGAAALGVVHRRRIPFPGDLIFFDDTHDFNKNGLVDDTFSHIGVVESVADDGTITLIHLAGPAGVYRCKMNLRYPTERYNAAGEEINSVLRVGQTVDGGAPTLLTGETWFAFASIRTTSPRVTQ